ncbi:MAG: hypothetical protein JSS65_14070 [Armatimonadetes bacterium]|nr:hypothetical protein [Armatimonadota bacterium]
MRNIAAIVLFAAMPLVSNAHFVWVYADTTKTARIEITDKPGEAPVPLKIVSGNKGTDFAPVGLQDIKPATDGKRLQALMTAPSGALTLVYGLHGDDLVTWYAKATTNLASAAKPLGRPYEITVRHDKNGLAATVWHDGKPFKGATVELYGNGLAKDLTLLSDSHGEVKFGAVKGGYLCIGAEIKVPQAGTHKGKQYKGKLEMASLTVRM